jgi:predicted Zn-dependent protease
MVGRKKLEQLSQKAIKKAVEMGATQVEVVLWSGAEELTRFANNEIHQSVSLEDMTIHVRAIVNNKIGVARGNSNISDIVKKAVQLAKIAPEDKHFKSLPSPKRYKDFSHVYRKSHHLGAAGRAEKIKDIFYQLPTTNYQLSTSGAFSESEGEVLIANSLGVLAYSETKSANLNVIVTGKSGSGYATGSAKGGQEIDTASVVTAAIEKATSYGEPITVEAGDYEVILEPAAVAELLDFFAWYGPNARIYHEDVSFLQNNLGKKVFDEKLTIYDDPHHPDIFPNGFDMEGHPKNILPIIEKGMAKNIAYDSYHAHKHGGRNTGHALLAPNVWGPIPTHLRIASGEWRVEDMIKKIKKGILVTRFWYTRVVHYKELMLTGMTRDGTFLIENGKITARVNNLRYTDSVIRVMGKIRGIGKDLKLEGSEGSAHLVPVLHLKSFRFTTATTEEK